MAEAGFAEAYDALAESHADLVEALDAQEKVEEHFRSCGPCNKPLDSPAANCERIAPLGQAADSLRSAALTKARKL